MRRSVPALAVTALCAAAPLHAEPWVAHEVEASFEDVAFDLKIAIEDRGFVIDMVSHVGGMLERTAEDVGGQAGLYEQADVYQFCSATLSREAMAADRMNIAYCPYGIFVFREPGAEVTVIGYRTFPEDAEAMQQVQATLDGIVREVAGID